MDKYCPGDDTLLLSGVNSKSVFAFASIPIPNIFITSVQCAHCISKDASRKCGIIDMIHVTVAHEMYDTSHFTICEPKLCACIQWNCITSALADEGICYRVLCVSCKIWGQFQISSVTKWYDTQSPMNGFCSFHINDDGNTMQTKCEEREYRLPMPTWRKLSATIQFQLYHVSHPISHPDNLLK